MAATKKVHVPKFGNWDGEDVAYTTYFENARKGKGDGSKMINPNDPEENPDAFMSGIFATGHEAREQQYNEDSFDSFLVNRHDTEHQSREDGQSQSYMRTPAHYSSENMDSYISGTPASNNLESYSNISNSDNSQLPLQYHDEPSKYTDEASLGFSPSTPVVLKTGNVRQGKFPHPKTASVPKFGIWDSMDPKSGESFTVIFSKVKEAKQIAANKLPTVPTETTNNHSRPKTPKNASIWSKTEQNALNNYSKNQTAATRASTNPTNIGPDMGPSNEAS